MNNYKESLEKELEDLQNYKTDNEHVLIIIQMRIIEVLKELKKMEEDK